MSEVSWVNVQSQTPWSDSEMENGIDLMGHSDIIINVNWRRWRKMLVYITLFKEFSTLKRTKWQTYSDSIFSLCEIMSRLTCRCSALILKSSISFLFTGLCYIMLTLDIPILNENKSNQNSWSLQSGSLNCSLLSKCVNTIMLKLGQLCPFFNWTFFFFGIELKFF